MLVSGFSLLFSSCGSVKLLQSEKTVVKPGVSFGTPGLQYAFNVSVLETTEFISLTINDSIIKTKFSVINLNSNLQSDNQNFYPEGNYKLQFDIPLIDRLKNSKDQVEIIVNQSGKVIYLKKKLKQIKEKNLK